MLADVADKLEFAEDNMILNEEFKKNVAIPYFKDIYKDLVSQSDSKSKGINKVTLLNVSIISRYSISYSTHNCPGSSVSVCSR